MIADYHCFNMQMKAIFNELNNNIGTVTGNIVDDNRLLDDNG
jgi:hypothetical protein